MILRYGDATVTDVKTIIKVTWPAVATVREGRAEVGQASVVAGWGVRIRGAFNRPGTLGARLLDGLGVPPHRPLLKRGTKVAV